MVALRAENARWRLAWEALLTPPTWSGGGSRADVVINLRYATADNFTGGRCIPSTSPCCAETAAS